MGGYLHEPLHGILGVRSGLIFGLRKRPSRGHPAFHLRRVHRLAVRTADRDTEAQPDGLRAIVWRDGMRYGALAPKYLKGNRSRRSLKDYPCKYTQMALEDQKRKIPFFKVQTHVMILDMSASFFRKFCNIQKQLKIIVFIVF